MINTLTRPIQIIYLDPVLLFANIYTSLIYAIYYSWFECFPLVYSAIYGFNTGQLRLSFLPVAISIIPALSTCYFYNRLVLEPDTRKEGFRHFEKTLVPAIYASPLLPLGLFLFGKSQIRLIYGSLSEL